MTGTDLRLDEVTYPHFGHDGDGHRVDNLFDEMGVALQGIEPLHRTG